MSNTGQFKPGSTGNPGGRSREQRSAARQQAAMIQKLTGNGKLTAEFALAVLIAGGEPDAEDGEDGEIMRKLAERTLRRYRIKPDEVTLRDKQWAATYLDDRGLGKPDVSIDIDGNAVGTVSLIPVDLGALTDEQLAAAKERVRAAREAPPPPGDGDPTG